MEGEWVPAREASVRMKMSIWNIKYRFKLGKVQMEKRNGRVFVFVPAVVNEPAPKPMFDESFHLICEEDLQESKQYNPIADAVKYCKAQIEAGRPIDRAEVAELSGLTAASNTLLIKEAQKLFKGGLFG